MTLLQVETPCLEYAPTPLLGSLLLIFSEPPQDHLLGCSLTSPDSPAFQLWFVLDRSSLGSHNTLCKSLIIALTLYYMLTYLSTLLDYAFLRTENVF